MSDSNLLINPLPIGWENHQFGEVCDRVKESYKPIEGGGTPYVGLEYPSAEAENANKSPKVGFETGDIRFGKFPTYFRKGAQVDYNTEAKEMKRALREILEKISV